MVPECIHSCIGAKFDGGDDDMTTGAVRRLNRHRRSKKLSSFSRPDALPVTVPTVPRVLKETDAT